MPDELRSCLISDLEKQFCEPVRLAIEQFLFIGLSRQPDQSNLLATIELPKPPRNWRTVLGSLLSLEDEEMSRDARFVKFIERRATESLFLRANRILRRLLQPYVQISFDARAVVLFFFAVALSLGMWAFSDDLAVLWANTF